jgi:hypothetical protein
MVHFKNNITDLSSKSSGDFKRNLDSFDRDRVLSIDAQSITIILFQNLIMYSFD